jgi:hypothetical protein
VGTLLKMLSKDWKDHLMVYFKVLNLHSPEGTESNYETYQTGQTANQPGSEEDFS